MLYSIFINDLINEVESVTNIWNTKVFLYADDVVIISKTKRSMMVAMKKENKHAIENGYRFNAKKCKLILKITYNELKIAGEEIERIKNFKILGVEFNLYGIDIWKQVKKNLIRTRNKWWSIKKLGLFMKNEIMMRKQLVILKTFII